MKRRERDRATRGAKDYRLLWAGLLLLVALIFACVGFSYGHIRRGLKNAADAEMVETTSENAAMLRLTLESRFALLDNVGEKIAEDPQNAQEMLTNLGKYANGYGFKRLGYMNSTGRTVTSDGETGDFFYRAYFRMGMDGQYCITGEINDRLGNGEAVHIMSAPVRNPKTGKVIGVVFADYTPEMFHQMMDVETFGGEGHGYIVESSGEIVVASSSARLTETGNLLDGVADFSETGRQDAEALRQVLAGEQPGDGRVLGAGKLRFCCRKIENGRQDDTWYLVMVMGAGALYGRMYGVFSSICSLLSVTVLRGKPSAFALELPPYRAPQVGQVLVRSVFDRTLFVLGRAAAVAAPAGMVLWALANVHPGGVSLLTRCAAALDPLGRVMGMDGVLLLAFVLGFPANEIVLPIAVMGYLAQGSLGDSLGLAQMHALLTANGWTWTTAVSAVLFFLLHWPCSTTLWTIRRETGSAKWTLLAALLPTALGMALCAAFTALTRLIGW